ncbi:MAG: AAA family ATPase [Deltaproteobacteria bacterium]|nr:AAA family ATPase [Deltaproteobacteria bacterium]
MPTRPGFCTSRPGQKNIFSFPAPPVGKSSLVSALEAILTGRRELFEELWIHEHSNYDWTPDQVIHLSLNPATTDSAAAVQSDLLTKLKDTAEDENPEPDGEAPADFFGSLIRSLNKKYGRKVAVLIDEYDALSCPNSLRLTWPASPGSLI